MKIIIIALCLTTSLLGTHAFGQELRSDHYYGTDDLVDYPNLEDEQTKGKDAEAWSQYLTDECTMYNKSNSNESQLRDIGLRRCRDNSVSFVQPKSTGTSGWEGKCGQTFGANSLYSICALAVNPKTYFSKYFKDITPGVRPGTIRKGMGKVFKQNALSCPRGSANRWRSEKLGSKNNFIKNVKQFVIPKYSHRNLIQVSRNGKSYLRNPIGVLIQNPGGNYLHWVTVVDIQSNPKSCQFVVNHWDNQYHVPCEKLAEWSGKVGKTYPIILKSYSTVVFK